LRDVLARVTRLPVEIAAEGLDLRPGHVYVAPSHADLAVLNGKLHVTPAAGIGPRLPIDSFFRSLADDLGPLSIGIVLSRAGTDGTFGLKAMKAAAGITFAQDPSTADHDSMPRSAVEGGFADFCLSPDEIAQELVHISRHPYLSRAHAPRPPPEGLSHLFLM